MCLHKFFINFEKFIKYSCVYFLLFVNYQSGKFEKLLKFLIKNKLKFGIFNDKKSL